MSENYYKLFRVTLSPNEPLSKTFDIFVSVELHQNKFSSIPGFSKAAELAQSKYPGASVKSVEVIDEPVYPVAL